MSSKGSRTKHSEKLHVQGARIVRCEARFDVPRKDVR